MKITNIQTYTTKNNNINNKSIHFGENRLSSQMSGNSAELMLQTPNAALNFEKDHYIARQADSAESNPLKSLGYKLYRTFGILINHETPKNNNNNKLSVVA